MADPSTGARLGPRQLGLLADLGAIHCALVVPDPISRRLVELGLLVAEPDGSFARLSPAGLRRLADEMEAGRVRGFSVPDHKDTQGDD